MSEEKIPERVEEFEDDSDNGQERQILPKKIAEIPDKSGEELDVERIRKAQEKIEGLAPEVVKNKNSTRQQIAEISKMKGVEDQIKKLTEIAVRDGFSTALKIVRALNNNYALDQMHDRFINEKELRDKLIKNGSLSDVK